MTTEENWSLNGPNWYDREEVLVYSDWLEERGEQVPAETVRWLLEAGKKPASYGAGKARIWTWWNAKFVDKVTQHCHHISEPIWEILTGLVPENEGYLMAKDYRSIRDAMNDVVKASRLHPKIFQKEIHEYHTVVAGAGAG